VYILATVNPAGSRRRMVASYNRQSTLFCTHLLAHITVRLYTLLEQTDGD
jgi:hypothetical protein